MIKRNTEIMTIKDINNFCLDNGYMIIANKGDPYIKKIMGA